MRTASRSCVSCTGELPEGAIFCPRCGTRSSESLDPAGDSGAPRRPPADVEGEHRARLQRALGEQWQLRRLVGRGGFAEVYAAWDPRLKREVAVKTIRHEIVASATVRERFQREAEAVATLRHPHIVPIYWVGEGEGIAFFVMPLIEGESLAALLERGAPLPVAEACRILREAAEALATAHGRGIVHRDVKPENIMLEGPGRRVVVMDFGIAKRADLAETGLTASGMVIGSPHYISPEQATGHPVDHRSDQYALAVAGYHMLAGRLPFDGESIRAILMRHAGEPVAPLRMLRPDVPPRVAAVVERALAKDPDERWPSLTAFATALAAAEPAHAESRDARRAQPSEESRIAAARTLLARWRRPAIATLVAGLAVWLATLGWVAPAPALGVAAARDEAMVAARALLVSHGAPADLPRAVELVAQDSVYRWLRRALPAESAVAAARAAAVWRWEVRQYDPARDEAWRVAVGPDDRVVEWGVIVSDSAPGARLAQAAARALAEAELRLRGIDPAALRPLSQESRLRPRRTDGSFAWALPGAPVARSGADSALRTVAVTVTGDRVTGYAERLEVPPPRAAASWLSGARVAAMIVGWLAVGLAVVMAAVVVTRRGRSDELQWSMALRLALLPVAVLMAISAQTLYADATTSVVPGGDPWTDSLIGFAFLVPLMLGVPLYVNVAAESLAHEHRPSLIAGLRDVAAGRWLVPELVPQALAGYAVALAVLGVRGIVVAMEHALLGAPRSAAVEAVLGWPYPSLGALAWLGAAIAAGMFLLHLLALAIHYRASQALALALPAATYALLAFGMAEPFDAGAVLAGTAAVFLVSAAIWRVGVLAGIIALFAIFALPDVAALLRAGSPDATLAGALGLAAVALPALLAVLAHRRRLASTPSGAAAG